MNPAIILLSLLFFTSLIMAIAMGVAWVHFGRERHVLTWAASYGVSMIQWIANAGGVAFKSPVWMGVSATAIVISGTLVVIGVIQRSRRPIHWPLLLGGGAVAAVGGILSVSPYGSIALRGMIVPGYVAILMAVSAAALWPRDRRFYAPEMAFFVMLILFALFEATLATTSAMVRGAGPGEGLELYRAVLGLGLPAIYVATGVAAVLVVAGDLAHLLRRQVGHDPLTGILNRRGVEEAADRAIANAQRHRRPLAIVACDLDRFKALNDGHGHLAGDAALRAFAQLLTSVIRRGDVVGRMGGDEFGLLLVDTDAGAAAMVMERVRVEMLCLTLEHAPLAALSASFGVAELRAGDDSFDALFTRADQALYAAKDAGKDRVKVWREAA